MRYCGQALILLLLAAVHNNAHKWADWELRGYVFNASGHALLAVLIAWLAYVYRRSAAMLMVCALVGAWVAQVAGCSLAWLMVGPWEVTPNGELCSDGLGFPLGAAGLMATALVVRKVYLWRQT